MARTSTLVGILGVVVAAAGLYKIQTWNAPRLPENVVSYEAKRDSSKVIYNQLYLRTRDLNVDETRARLDETLVFLDEARRLTAEADNLLISPGFTDSARVYWDLKQRDDDYRGLVTALVVVGLVGAAIAITRKS